MQPSLLVIALSLELIHARLLDRPQDLSKHEYDYIIVGGGTAGSVLANRLTEDPANTVLVIEAGGSNVASNDDLIQVPFFVGNATKTKFDWNYTTTAQAGFDNRSISLPRGHVLGGSSSINYMFYTRGSSDDWDQFARISGDNGWSWKKMFPYFLKSETLTAPADSHNTTGQINPKYHGTKGPLLTSLPAMGLPIDSLVLNTTIQLKSEFPFNLDMNSGNPLGLGTLQSTIANGKRSSAATAFLTPILSQRSNLDVLVNGHVTKLVQAARKATTPTFKKVQFSQTGQSPSHFVTASKEILLTAGAIGTPQLLMLSGIGDSQSLRKFGIKPIVNLPDVGKNMFDHPFVALQWSVNSNNTYDQLDHFPEALQAALNEYDTNHQGPLANNPAANNIGFFRLPKSSNILKGRKDPAGGPVTPHFELVFTNAFFSFSQPPPATGNYISTCIAVTAPESRGSVQLASIDPFVQPLINPNMLTEDIDISIMTEAVKMAQRFLQAPAWKDYINAPYVDSANLTSDAAIKDYIKSFASSFNHAAGTAKISNSQENGGVVGPDLKVKGAAGLRVVDASVLPFAFGAHFQAIVYAIAERAADLIRNA